MNVITSIAQRLNVSESSVKAVFGLLDEDQTIPFIARYRKEVTGNLDEVVLLAIRDERERLAELEKRRAAIFDSLKETGHWTPALETQALACVTLTALEDFYLPYRPKRKTRATMALEKGLGALADQLWANREPTPADLARFVAADKGVATPDEALAGARDILAEKLAENAEVRKRLRDRYAREGRLGVGAARGAPKDHPFVEHVGKTEALTTMPGHRLLAVLRGEAEKFLSVSVDVDPDGAWSDVVAAALPRGTKPVPSLSEAVADSVKRLLGPSLENEALKAARERAEAGAIRIFAENLRQVLLAAPLGQKALLAVDPGQRTGCKVVVLSAQGTLLDHGVIYPLEPHKKLQEAEKLVRSAVAKYKLQAVAVGNGTGGRESEAWLKGLNLGIPVFSVNESGASVYSASEVAREEFPEYDLTVRGAVSIGRRLMDPLAELVKVDPKAIGVGQYQHDVDQKELKKGLDDVVVSCVNKVGVDVNLATKPILTYVAGLSGKLAASIVEHRTKHGPFRRRKDLLEVKGLGPKAFEQAAGFLRIVGGDDPLDASAVHPESYPVVAQLATKAGCAVAELIGRPDLAQLAKGAEKDLGVGRATLDDIVKELEKPGRDPRPPFEVVTFDDSIQTMDDLKEGQVLNGIVTNVTDFGAFVDIGVHQDGLIHVSQLANTFVKNALDVLKPGQTVKVMVMTVDKAKKRISLSRKACL
jgi:uncharacterized protein